MILVNSSSSSAVYPRPCGGNGETGYHYGASKGLSPPVRGKQVGGRQFLSFLRSIPARAGETLAEPGDEDEDEVYPRPCGGNAGNRDLAGGAGGLSPPVRGKRNDDKRGTVGGGSIPARAGETSTPPTAGLARGVYPRPCGGNCSSSRITSEYRGLSPPVRGKRELERGLGVWHRSIPARAGETRVGKGARGLAQVYPRPCGGNASWKGG